MWQLIADALLDSVMDTVKIVPFLFLTYVLMEYLEHRTGTKTLAVIRKADKMGPLFGGILGIIPQCGFSAAASGFYAGRVITAGTLIAVFLSTSDEMLPIMISSRVPLATIGRILVTKALIGIAAGFMTDMIFKILNRRKIGESIHDLCEHDHCHCDEETNLLRSALRHTLEITAFLFLITAGLTILIELAGTGNLRNLILNKPVIGELLAGIIGLIPNCAASVTITTLYMEGGMSAGAMMSGLLVGAGVGLLVLFRTNNKLKDNLLVAGILYGFGVAGGLLVDLLHIVF